MKVMRDASGAPVFSAGWKSLPHHLHAEALWQAIREEARGEAVR